ncbi:AsmA family protein [Kushneria phosphatilytica]|uniref:AsmA family protein n=1 Tax=Kushneria phosphatilytica TaxID=657387 RepID=A0A1S1NTE8_9GAMM|nr:AsmA family protein [Kushneria phosphatilytica]OHV08875.1 hypothetical protein BH688_12770 [Kushneria phosphatilytica]QEL12596.1 AsmA family protein [Kushneria phosphatilytica]
MNRHPVRWLFGCLLGIPASLLGLAVAVLVTLSLIPLNWLRPVIDEQVSRALQRPFAIRGTLQLDWQSLPGHVLPLPALRAGDLILGNPRDFQSPTGKAAPMVQLASVEAGIALPALLYRRINIPRVTLTQPQAELIRLADGRNNWTFSFGDNDASKASDSESDSGWTVAIDDIVFDQSRVVYRDAVLDADITVTLDPLGQPVPYAEIVGQAREDRDARGPADYRFGWQVEGRYKGEPLEGSGRIGGMLSLRQGQQPFPLQVDLRSGETHIKVTGTLTDPLNLGALDLHLALEGRSLGNLYALTGVVLPDTPPYATNGHLVARLRRPEGSLFEYQEFKATIGGSDLSGTLTYTDRKPRPILRGTLDARRLRMVDLGPLIGSDDDRTASTDDAPRQPPGKVLPVSEFRTDRWNRMDADVRFRAARIEHGAALPLSDLDTHIVLDNGELLLDPLHFSMAGGALNTTLRLNGNRSPMQARIDMHARRLQLKQLIPAPGDMQDALGQLNGDATLTGHGNSVAALLGSGSGEVKMLIDNGLISRNLMELAGLNVGNYVVGKLFGDEQVRIHCAAADLIFRNGLMRPKLFFIDTENATVDIDGAIDFGSERMDLTIDPQGKGLRILTLHSPLYVSGTFKNPAPGVKAGPLAARAAAAVALGAIAPPAALLALISPNSGQEQQCSALLQKRTTSQ